MMQTYTKRLRSATIDDLLPSWTDRVVFVGQTGSGKTTLAEVLLRSRPWVVAVDVKGTLRWPMYRLVRKLSDLPRDAVAQPRVIYRPTHDELRDAKYLDAVAWWVYERRNTTLYVDELYGYLEPFAAQGIMLPPGLHACLTRGRERGVEVWCSTQRPFRVPLSVLSESEHVYVFRLRVKEDRKRIEEVTGLEEGEIARLPKHVFYYCPQDGEIVGPITLKIGG